MPAEHTCLIQHDGEGLTLIDDLLAEPVIRLVRMVVAETDFPGQLVAVRKPDRIAELAPDVGIGNFTLIDIDLMGLAGLSGTEVRPLAFAFAGGQTECGADGKYDEQGGGEVRSFAHCLTP